MFYSQFILAKKGPLGTIWIAAHLERKLRKNQVADTDIGFSVDSILFPDVPIALRLSSHLLLGVVRIYSRKVNYLFDDCSEALLKIKQAFRSTAVDLPPEESTAPYHSITLPETFDLDDFELPDNEMFQGNDVDHHVSTREQITLQDTMEGVVYTTSQFGLDERFGDGTSQIGLDLDEELFTSKVAVPDHIEVATCDHNDVALSENAQASVQPATPLKIDEINEGTTETSDAMLDDGNRNQMHGFAPSADLTEYADAPVTPGLVEEPLLINAQDTFILDDNLGTSIDNNSAGFTVEENVESKFSCSDHHLESRNPVSFNCNDMVSSEVPPEPAEDNTCFFGQLISEQTKSGENSMHHTEANNYVSLDNAIAEPLPCSGLDKQAQPTSMGLTSLDSEVQQDGGQSDNQPNETILDNVENEPEGAKMGEAVASSVLCYEKTTELCSDIEMTQKSYDTNEAPQPVLEESGVMDTSPTKPSVMEIDKQDAEASGEPGHFKIVRHSGFQETPSPCSPRRTESDVLSQGANIIAEVPDLPSRVDSQHSLEGVGEELTNTSALPEVQGEGCEEASFVIPTPEVNHASDPSLCKDIQAESSKLNEELEIEFPLDTQLENLDKSSKSDLPAPEKMLSMPEEQTHLQHDFLMESTVEKAVQVEDEKDSTGITGKKRTFTESTLTTETHMLEESFSSHRSERTERSIPGDDDLLSSILVGRRSSIWKIKPTPPEVAVAKRPRPGPRVGTSKRKVIMDDSMVLHGDTIRQQLTDTGDIRRVRKKAPCTRPEIWMIQKQFLDDNFFSEPISTDMCTELFLLHGELYDLSGIKLSQNDDSNPPFRSCEVMDVPLRLDITEKSESGAGNDGISTVRHDYSSVGAHEDVFLRSYVTTEAEVDAGNNEVSISRSEKETVPDSVLLPDEGLECEKQLSNTHVQDKDSLDAHELVNFDSEALLVTCNSNIEHPDAAEYSVTVGAESPTPAAPSKDVCDKTDNTESQPALLDKTCGSDASLHVNPLHLSPDVKLDEQSSERNNLLVLASKSEHHLETQIGQSVEDETRTRENGCPCANDVNSFLNEDIGVIGAALVSKSELHLETGNGCPVYGPCAHETGCNCTSDAYPSFARFSHETDKLNDRVDLIKDYPEVCGEDEIVPHNESININRESDRDHKTEGLGNATVEEPKLDASYSVELGVKSALLNSGENACCPEAISQKQKNVEVENMDFDLPNIEDHGGLENIMMGDDTEFLNVDDDDAAEEDDNYMPSKEDAHFLENSGWSSRTRAVAKFLQTLFDREAENGKRVLPMNNLLSNKTRKEASRMFFEALVLKTKDYIHVEQSNPFENISIKPRMKLMKSDF